MPTAKSKTLAAALKAKFDEQGGLLTQQRMAVYEYLQSVEHHPTAEEVFLAVKARLPKISLATVYKNSEALVARGAASKLSYGDAAARYDIRTDHHYHSRCLACGCVTDVEPTGTTSSGGAGQSAQRFSGGRLPRRAFRLLPSLQTINNHLTSEGGIMPKTYATSIDLDSETRAQVMSCSTSNWPTLSTCTARPSRRIGM
jgi:Fe2+ or Zn2+ uptake regulation protein